MGAGTGHYDQEIVREADEPVGGVTPRSVLPAPRRSAVRLPGRLEVAVEYREGYVRKQR
jgi:hypothetical protein